MPYSAPLTTIFTETMATTEGAALIAAYNAQAIIDGEAQITGLWQHVAGEHDWGSRFRANLHLIDYYLLSVLNPGPSEYVDRTGPSVPVASQPIRILKAISLNPNVTRTPADPLDRLEYAWEVVKGSELDYVDDSGFIQGAIQRWGAAITASGEIPADGYLAHSLIQTVSGLPVVDYYGWDRLEYPDNYEGNTVLLKNFTQLPPIAIGPMTDATTGKTGISVDLTADPNRYVSGDLTYEGVDSIAAPTISGEYYVEQPGASYYYDAQVNDYYNMDAETTPSLKMPQLWTDNETDGNWTVGTIYPFGDDKVAERTVNVNIGESLSGDYNTLARDIAHKTVVYACRVLNRLTRLVYGYAIGHETNIALPSGDLPTSLYLTHTDSAPVVSPSGDPWPVYDNPYVSGDWHYEPQPDSSGDMYTNLESPDWAYRRLINEINAGDIGDFTHGSMMWASTNLAYLRYRIAHLAGSRDSDDSGNRLWGGRVWRSLMQVTEATVLPTLTTPGAPEDEGDGVYKVEGDDTYWFVKDGAWLPAWTTNTALISAYFGNVPAAYYDLEGKGITALPTVTESWLSPVKRTFTPADQASGELHIAPGIDVYSRVLAEVYDDKLTGEFVDESKKLPGYDLGEYPMEDYSDQYITAFTDTHEKIGHIETFETQTGIDLVDLIPDDFQETILFDASGDFNHAQYVRGLANIIRWHMQSMADLNAGEFDIASYPTNWEGKMAWDTYKNEVDSYTDASGDARIGPHAFHWETKPGNTGFYGGIQLKYYDGD